MGNVFMNELENYGNMGFTENGSVQRNSTKNNVYDMFALGAAMRNRPDADVILLFKKALEEDESLALKCLFYIRDIRGGQGERRFFRVCLKWLGNTKPEIAMRNLSLISEYGRWDDILELIGTKIEKESLELLKNQFLLDSQCETPSLLAKWLPSENASSKETKKKGRIVRCAFGLTSKQYRISLSTLRTRINVLEKLMSSNQWDKIEFDKIPSKAGLVYKNAFARRDLIAKKYSEFAQDETKTVNAKALYPYEIVEKALQCRYGDKTDRLMIQKYWDNQKDYLNGSDLKMLSVIDTSGSMQGTPINVAISLGIYAAERMSGAFAGKYISFASRPKLINVEGIDIVDKVERIYRTNLIDNTNLEAVFDLVLDTAIKTNCPKEDLPEVITIISDMQIDSGCRISESKTQTLMEQIRVKWQSKGYEMPKLVYWNVDARQNTILDAGPNVSYVSGMSPVIYESILTGKTGVDLMLDKLLSERYAVIK